MPLQIFGLTLIVIAAGPLPPNRDSIPRVTRPTVDLGLSAPIESFDDVEAFANRLAKRLVWTVGSEDGTISDGEIPATTPLRFTALRIDRGRVTASFQTDPIEVPQGLTRISDVAEAGSFLAFADVCLRPDDPPTAVLALSGAVRLDAEALEMAVANTAHTRRLDAGFGLDRSLTMEWGRHVLLVLAAASEETILVRPVVLVLERL